MSIIIHCEVDPKKAMRRAQWLAKKEAMKYGRKERAHTFAAKKGKGSYKRKNKHKENYGG